MKSTRSFLLKNDAAPEHIFRLTISVCGVVQGVGFRPFVYQLAARHHLNGWVRNTSGDVRIEVEGKPAALDRFLDELETIAPPLARIEKVTATAAPALGYPCFEIQESEAETGKYQLVSPDIATCPECRSEVLSTQDRRYRYPFTNCTNCGPRFTIIEDIPYDRPRTTMRHFQMCPSCRREYDSPLDRRFHAQPNACPDCGPQLELVAASGGTLPGDDPIAIASRLLREGKIIAVKGLGGFLLACDATSETAVQILRRRKRRAVKPLAVMLATMDEVKRQCRVSPEEEALLTSPQCPIVLLARRDGSTLAPLVAPGLKYLGVMLPYTPLHHILCREAGLPLVMTSGNLSEEPIARDNDEAFQRLHSIADYFLWHNRDISSRYDDSVTLVELGWPRMVRRARGYAPYPVHLPFAARQVLACGGELKNSFCLTRDNYAFFSQHIGDLENLETLEHYEETIELYRRLFRIRPEIIAYDMHPEYLATKYAKDLAEKSPGLVPVPVQHHHAHIVSCLADSGLQERVIGVSFDGTGYGTDGALWGGEFLAADYAGFERLGHFQYVPLPGGAAAIEKPYRMTISYLLSLFGANILKKDIRLWRGIDPLEMELVKRQIERSVNSPLTSSCGRLFDAVAALIGIHAGRIDYEAQAAIELEMAAEESERGAYPFVIIEQDGRLVVSFAEMFAAILDDLDRKNGRGNIAMKFHSTMAEVVTEMCRRLSRRTGIEKVALSGGVFQNRLLLRLAVASLEEAGLTVLTHHDVPTNDGGISLGQAVIANFATTGEG